MSYTLGKYTLLQTLGSGANSKVKLAVDKQTNQYVAIKILKKGGNANMDHKFLELVMTEVKTLIQLKHPNILNLIEYSKDGIIQHSSGKKVERVIYIVLELATGGELFDFVAIGGRYSEEVCRFYFRQLIDGLNYVHQNGVTHRDLKPENLLYDGDFNLKIADFGFAAPITGRDDSGFLRTRLGTESYMAPEIHMKQGYTGESVDLFAAAIILFIMFTQHPPFHKALPEDPFYKLVCIGRLDVFWKAHARNKPDGEDFFSEDFKDLISRLIAYDPSKRMTMQQVISHPWLNKGPVATPEQIKKEFLQRQQSIKQDQEIKAREKENQKNLEYQKAKLKEQMLKSGVKKVAYKGVNRSEGVDQEEEKREELELRIQEPYINVISKHTEFFTLQDADVLLTQLLELAQEQCSQYQVSKNKYQIKMQFQIKNENQEEEEERNMQQDDEATPIEMLIRILKVDKERNCIEVQRRSGDIFAFHDYYRKIQEFVGDLAEVGPSQADKEDGEGEGEQEQNLIGASVEVQ